MKRKDTLVPYAAFRAWMLINIRTGGVLYYSMRQRRDDVWSYHLRGFSNPDAIRTRMSDAGWRVRPVYVEEKGS